MKRTVQKENILFCSYLHSFTEILEYEIQNSFPPDYKKKHNGGRRKNTLAYNTLRIKRRQKIQLLLLLILLSGTLIVNPSILLSYDIF